MQTIQDFGKGHLITAENDQEIDSLVSAERWEAERRLEGKCDGYTMRHADFCTGKSATDRKLPQEKQL